MTTPTDNNERRSSSDRRQFTYSANIPEKRSGMENRCKEERRKSKDRRKLVDRRGAVYRSWYNEHEKRSLKFRRNDTNRRSRTTALESHISSHSHQQYSKNKELWS
jgi:hypothetical protein